MAGWMAYIFDDLLGVCVCVVRGGGRISMSHGAGVRGGISFGR